MAARCLLLDLDGVVRHFDRSVADRLEREHDLAPGSLRREAFEHPRGYAAITGELTRSEWTEQVGRAVGSIAAAHEWLGTWGTADPVMVAAIERIRASGTPVATLTNGTDTIHRELEACGLTDVFDRVYCSWYLRRAKPDPEVFRMVCADLGVVPAEVAFFDDSPANVAGAREAGLSAAPFENARQVLAAVGQLR